VRAFLTPANLGTTIAPWIVFAGFFLGRAGGTIMDIGILLFSAAVLFHLVTLPVEFNASRRAVQELQTAGVVAPNEVGAVRAVVGPTAGRRDTRDLSRCGRAGRPTRSRWRRSAIP
jgi:Zn-dependent membrane protease YugP